MDCPLAQDLELNSEKNQPINSEQFWFLLFLFIKGKKEFYSAFSGLLIFQVIWWYQ